MGEKCQCHVSVVWTEGTGNLPPTNLPPQTALEVTCVGVQKEKKLILKKNLLHEFLKPVSRKCSSQNKIEKNPVKKLANLSQI